MASPPSVSALDLLEQELSSHSRRLRRLAARARKGGDEELVHDVRVALRRLEALARLFRGVPSEGDGEAVREPARSLRRRLSLLRSEEVGRALLAQRTESTDPGLAELVFPIGLPAVRVGAVELTPVGRAVAVWRRRLSSSFDGPFAPRAGGEAEVLQRTHRRLRRRLSELASLLPPRRKTIHPARIAAKRVRYALEIVEPLDPGVGPVLRLLRAFQAAAGDAHDLLELAARVRAVRGAETLARALEADAGRAISAALRRGVALSGPILRMRSQLVLPKTR